MAKKTQNLNLPIISPDDYPTTKVKDMIDDVQGDKEGSAFNIIDSAVGMINTDISSINNKLNSVDGQIETLSGELDGKQDQIIVNPAGEAYLELSKIKIDGLTYKLKTGITDVDAALLPDSENPVQNKVIFNTLSNFVTSQEVSRMIDDAIKYSLETKY